MSDTAAQVYRRLAKAYRDETGIRLDYFDVKLLVKGDDAIHTVVMDTLRELDEKASEDARP